MYQKTTYGYQEPYSYHVSLTRFTDKVLPSILSLITIFFHFFFLDFLFQLETIRVPQGLNSILSLFYHNDFLIFALSARIGIFPSLSSVITSEAVYTDLRAHTLQGSDWTLVLVDMSHRSMLAAYMAVGNPQPPVGEEIGYHNPVAAGSTPGTEPRAPVLSQSPSD